MENSKIVLRISVTGMRQLDPVRSSLFEIAVMKCFVSLDQRRLRAAGNKEH